MIPILHFPGEMMPGQLGPMRRVFRPLRKLQTCSMSRAGIPSVMQTTSSRPASAASRMASAAKGGGTKITLALASLLGSGFPNRVVDGKAVVPGASLAGSDACDHLGAVAAALGRMKAALTARDALNHDSGCRIHPDGHSTILR